MGHAHTPPELPEVSDEAANTPRWVPLLGLALLVASAGTIVWYHAGESDGADSAADVEAP